MATLFVDRRNASLDLENGAVVVRVNGERQGAAPLGPLDKVVVHGAAHVSTRLLLRLAERGIGLLAIGAGARSQAVSMSPPTTGDARIRIAQYALASDESARARLAAQIIYAKTLSQRRVLLELAKDVGRRPKAMREAIDAIDRTIERLEKYPDIERAQLRGIEGATARAYFAGVGAILPPALGFTGRNRRPPRDPFNVCLSLIHI